MPVRKGASAVLKKKLISLLMTFSLFVLPVFAEDTAVSAFVEGCRAYTGGDWSSAIFAFRKAVSFSETNTPETNFMLINAEIYSIYFSLTKSYIYMNYNKNLIVKNP